MIKSIQLFLAIIFTFSTFFSYGTNYVWNQKANFGGTARHRGSAFVIGNKGYIGLGHFNAITNILFEDFWEYEPASNTWTQKANFGGGLRYHAISFSIGNKAYVGTGRNENNVYQNDLWEYNSETNSWSQMANLPGTPRRGAVSFTIDNKGYVATGQLQVSPGATNDLWEYNATSNSWIQKSPMPTAGRYSAVGFSINHLGYVGTGYLNGSGSTNDLWEYNPQTDSWSQKSDIGPTNRMEATAFALDGIGYIGTGVNYSSGTNYGDMWAFNPDLNTNTQIQDFPGTKRRYLLSFTINNKAYAGIGTNGTNFNDFWEMSENTVSVEQLNTNHFSSSIFPNPCKKIATIKINNLASTNISKYIFSVFNVYGKKVDEITSTYPKLKFDRKELKNGVYTYRINANNQFITAGKLILN